MTYEGKLCSLAVEPQVMGETSSVDEEEVEEMSSTIVAADW